MGRFAHRAAGQAVTRTVRNGASDWLSCWRTVNMHHQRGDLKVSLQHHTPEAPAGHLVIQIDAAIKCVNPTDCAIAAVGRSLEVATVQVILVARLLATRVTWSALPSSRVLEAILIMWVGSSLCLLSTRFWHNSCSTKIITG